MMTRKYYICTVQYAKCTKIQNETKSPFLSGSPALQAPFHGWPLYQFLVYNLYIYTQAHIHTHSHSLCQQRKFTVMYLTFFLLTLYFGDPYRPLTVFFFFAHSQHVEVPGPESNPCHSSNLNHCSDNAGSLSCCTTRELQSQTVLVAYL